MLLFKDFDNKIYASYTKINSDNMFLQHEYLECPFCKRGVIEFLYKPSTLSASRTSCRAGKSTSWRRSSDEVIITTEKCPECGKTAKEIAKKWKDEGVI